VIVPLNLKEREKIKKIRKKDKRKYGEEAH
jgi:hypothetical protein